MRFRGIAAAITLAFVALALCAGTVAGQIPEKMDYQVRLTDDADQPLANESHGFSFRIHGIATGGPILWQENHNLTTDANGVVSVILGSINPLNISFDVPLWLEIRIEDEILTPRRELISAPYALYARTTENVDHAATADTALYAFFAANAGSLGGTDAASFVQYADLTDYVPRVEVTPAGTINDTSNVVDWTRLKGVPADFADGVDDGGTADGHSLDADDGDPVDAVYVDSDGLVGIGTTFPMFNITIVDTFMAGIQMVAAPGGPAPTRQMGFVLGTDDTGDAFIVQTEDAPIYVAFMEEPAATFYPDGVVEIGNSTQDGRLDMVAADGRGTMASLYNYDTEGGSLELVTWSGTPHTNLEPDVDGDAGFLWVEANDGGVMVDGNDNSDDSPFVAIFGSGSTTEFDASESGDGSVNLPNDAVGSYEILDEPGAACYYTSTLGQVLVTYNPMTSHSITVPGPGYVFAAASGQANCTYDSTSVNTLYFGISADSTVIQEGLDLEIELPAGLPSASYGFTLAPSAVFEVASAGTYTYYLPASADGTWYLYDTTISLIYVPTAYGTVSGPAKVAASHDDSAAFMPSSTPDERRWESEAANDARIARELAEMEARIAELKGELESRNNH